MDKPFARIGAKLGRIFDCALVKPLPWNIIDAHEKLRETDSRKLNDADPPDKIELIDPEVVPPKSRER